MKPANILILALLIGSQYALWFGDKNIFDLYQMREGIEKRALLNLDLKKRNQSMVAEVNDLKQGGETVETIARSELGMIKKGETFYQVIE